MADEKLIIDFWNVGLGDSTIIRLPDQKLIIIDTGPLGSPILTWLSKRTEEIHAIIVTHNDADHAGSLPSLVKMPGKKIHSVFMLIDRDKKSEQFQNIWRPARQEEKAGRLKISNLEADTVIWANQNNSIEVRHPSFSEGVEANNPNSASGIVCLLHKGEVLMIWPGDVPMKKIGEKCAGTTPHVLMGPHHGAPIDRDNKRFDKDVEKFKPERMFVSVGTELKYSDVPSPKYLGMQTRRGIRVMCSQLTSFCDKRISKPFIQTALLLGLHDCNSGISCRGCYRVTVAGSKITPDPYDAPHWDGVKKLKRPKCVKRI